MTCSPEPPSGRVSPDAYREVLGLFATGVTVVTTTEPGSRQPHGMTANAFMSVSLDPPLVLASVRRDAHLHRLLEETGGYGVSILGDSSEREARRFAGMAMPAHEPPPAFDWHCGTPVLRGVLAWLVTRVVDAHPAGDHTLFIGQILDLEVDLPDHRPLGFYRSTFAEVAVLAGREPVPLHAWEHPTGLWG